MPTQEYDQNGQPMWDDIDEADGADLLDDVAAFVARFVALPSPHALTAVVLWAAHAHCLDSFESTPRLAVLSPEAGSGKTRLLEVLELLVPAPLHALSASPAAIFRTIAAERPTLLFDEVDAIFSTRGKDDASEDLRALLNAGHRAGATIPRCVGPRHEVTRFEVYAAVALAGLGDLPETLMTRSVILRMRRRAPQEQVEPFRHRQAAPEGRALGRALGEWAGGLDIADEWPEMPPGVTDRPADVWEALLAIADAAGGHWPNTARDACVELCKVAASRDHSLGVKLLMDLHTIFDGEDRLTTEAVLERLVELDESPWGDLRGKALDARGLARRLRQYDVSPKKLRIGDSTARGYERGDLLDAWERYLPSGDAEQAEREEHPRSAAPPGVPHDETVPEHAAPPSGTRNTDGTANGAVTSDVPAVPDVPLIPTEERCVSCGIPIVPAPGSKQKRHSTVCGACSDYQPDEMAS